MTKPDFTAAAAASGDRIALMQTFVRIVEAGSLSAAAQQLGTTQPTVSRRLKALEASLGLRLLQRSTHALGLTEDGERCFERAKELLTNWQAFEADLRGAGDEPEGLLRVVAPHAFGQRQLVAPLADYLRRHARVNVEWMLHDGTPEFVSQGIDCAIQVGEITDPSVVAIRLSEIPRIVVAAPGIATARQMRGDPRELASLPWLALRTFYRTEVELLHEKDGRRARIPIQPRLSTDSLFALRSAALEGLGVCIASQWVLQDDLAAGALVHLVPEWRAEPLPMHIIYPYASFYPARLKRFVETMRTAMKGAFTPA